MVHRNAVDVERTAHSRFELWRSAPDGAGYGPYVDPSWNPLQIEAAIGGIILGISGLLFFGNMLATALSRKRVEVREEMPVAEPLHPEHVTPGWLDSWRPWLVATVLLILVAYGPVLVSMIANISLTSPGVQIR